MTEAIQFQHTGIGPAVPHFEQARVADAMHPEVLTCPADAPLRTVACMMAAERVHCIVVDGGGEERAWGIVSDLDLVGRAGTDIDERTAGWAATSEFLTVTPGESLKRAVQLMVEHETAHLVVIDAGSARPLGVLSTLDVANVLAWGRP